MNYSHGQQQSQAQSGLRGTPYEGQAESGAIGSAKNLQNVAGQAQNVVGPGGQTQYGGVTGAQFLPGGQFGLGTNTDMAMNQLAKQMFGFSSGVYGSRGYLSPENQGAIVGSAITNALPQLIPYTQGWQQAQFQAPMTVGGYATQQAAAPAQQYASLIGAQSQGSGSNFGFGFQTSDKGSGVLPGAMFAA